jgi:hypothetical protein
MFDRMSPVSLLVEAEMKKEGVVRELRGVFAFGPLEPASEDALHSQFEARSSDTLGGPDRLYISIGARKASWRALPHSCVRMRA